MRAPRHYKILNNIFFHTMNSPLYQNYLTRRSCVLISIPSILLLLFWLESDNGRFSSDIFKTSGARARTRVAKSRVNLKRRKKRKNSLRAASFSRRADDLAITCPRADISTIEPGVPAINRKWNQQKRSVNGGKSVRIRRAYVGCGQYESSADGRIEIERIRAGNRRHRDPRRSQAAGKLDTR